MLTLPIFTAIELAERLNKTPQAIYRDSKNFTKIRLFWKDENGKKRTGKFYMPAGYRLIHEDDII